MLLKTNAYAKTVKTTKKMGIKLENIKGKLDKKFWVRHFLLLVCKVQILVKKKIIQRNSKSVDSDEKKYFRNDKIKSYDMLFGRFHQNKKKDVWVLSNTSVPFIWLRFHAGEDSPFSDMPHSVKKNALSVFEISITCKRRQKDVFKTSRVRFFNAFPTDIHYSRGPSAWSSKETEINF